VARHKLVDHWRQSGREQRALAQSDPGDEAVTMADPLRTLRIPLILTEPRWEFALALRRLEYSTGQFTSAAATARYLPSGTPPRDWQTYPSDLRTGRR